MSWFKKAVEICESETDFEYLNERVKDLSGQLGNVKAELNAVSASNTIFRRQMKMLLEHLDLREEFKSTQYMAIQPRGMPRLQTLETDHRLEKIKRCKTCNQEIKK